MKYAEEIAKHIELLETLSPYQLLGSIESWDKLAATCRGKIATEPSLHECLHDVQVMAQTIADAARNLLQAAHTE